jgi:hypothetical protein
MDLLAASLNKILRSTQSGNDLEMAAQFAPTLLLDNNEPFRPQVVGCTIFREDGPSPSFPRHIRRSASQEPAEIIIEYALWWDWDINHLYELEHIWIYIDQGKRVVGLESSWHGSIRDLYKQGAIKFDGCHPLLLASPGKHAFDLDSRHFLMHQAKYPGITSKYAGINGTEQPVLFAQTIKRTPVSDRLVHSYLSRFAFEPSWQFDTRIKLGKGMLVPWSALESWIPDRVGLWHNFLNGEIGPLAYRPLRTALCSSTEEIRRAGELGLDMVMLNVTGRKFGLPYLLDGCRNKAVTNMLTVLRTCYTSRIGVYLNVRDERSLPWLTWLLGRRDWSDYLMLGSDNEALLLEIKGRLPHYRTVLVREKPSPEVIQGASDLKASYIHICSRDTDDFNESWIQQAHQADIGLIAGPIKRVSSWKALSNRKLDALVLEPDLFSHLDIVYPKNNELPQQELEPS